MPKLFRFNDYRIQYFIAPGSMNPPEANQPNMGP
jgi:hypothetical protein